MPQLSLRGVSKDFGDTRVIHDISATIDDNEFLVLLGPSGCGKSTMLRMIAGLAEVSTGEICFDGSSVNELSPRERNVAFVFQSYALYPHMSVRGNIAFPLVMDRFKWWHHLPVVNSITRRALMRNKEVRDQVETVAEMLELGPYLDRRPRNLSGGQRQRVAVARALVREPSLYLLDEPLSNLDAQLRTQMRAEISALYRRAGKTFVYVTHDQVEAMTMGTKIIVLESGTVQQMGTPSEIYERPANAFVARFIGSPAMNLLPATVSEGRASLASDSGATPMRVGLDDGEYLMGVRPEAITLLPREGAGPQAQIAVVEHLGGETVVGFKLGSADVDKIGGSASRGLHFAKVAGSVFFEVGTTHAVSIDDHAVSWFDAETQQRVEPRDGAA